PDTLIRPTGPSPPSVSMSATTTRAPCSAKCRADARPIPDAAPVTIATFPSNCIIGPPSQPLPVHPSVADLAVHDHLGRQQREVGVGELELPGLIGTRPVRVRRDLEVVDDAVAGDLPTAR